MKFDILSKFLGTGSIVALSKLLGILFGVVCARWLGPEEYGAYTYLISITTILMTISMAGVPHILIRKIAEYRVKNKNYNVYIHWSYIHIVVLSLIMIVIALLTNSHSSLFGWDKYALFTVCLVIPLRALNAQQSACLNGIGRSAIAQLPFSLFVPLFSLIILLLAYLADVSIRINEFYAIYIIALILSFVVSQIVVVSINKKYLFSYVKDRFDIGFFKKVYIELAPYSITVIVLTINAELAMVYLGSGANTESVALYRVAIQLMSVVSMLYFVVNTVLQPQVSSLYSKRDISALQEVVKLSSRFVFFLSVPFLLIVYYWSEELLTIVFGHEYASAKYILRIMCVAQFVISLLSSSPVVLNMTGNQKASMKCSYISLGSNIILLTALTPYYKEVGVAYAYFFSNAILYLTMSYFSLKKIKLKTWVH